MAVNGQMITDDYAIYNGDCIEVMRDLPDESIGLINNRRGIGIELKDSYYRRRNTKTLKRVYSTMR